MPYLNIMSEETSLEKLPLEGKKNSTVIVELFAFTQLAAPLVWISIEKRL